MKLISLIVVLILWSASAFGAGRISQFEQKDIVGDTVNINQTEGITAVAVPAVADKAIAEVLVRCPVQAGSKTCLVSFTAIGGPFITLQEGEFIIWQLKGYKKQFWIQGGSAGTEFEMVVNYEP